MLHSALDGFAALFDFFMCIFDAFNKHTDAMILAANVFNKFLDDFALMLVRQV